MSQECSNNFDQKDCSDDTFLNLLYDWAVKNVSMPNDLGTMIAYVLLVLLVWYIILSAVRFVFSLVWPIIFVVSAVLLFRFLRTFDRNDLSELLLHALGVGVDELVKALRKSAEFLLNLFT